MIEPSSTRVFFGTMSKCLPNLHACLGHETLAPPRQSPQVELSSAELIDVE
jgi:hypothetical protein